MFIYGYLDNIIIFSDLSIEDHVNYIKLVFDILRKEKLYFGPSKMQSLGARRCFHWFPGSLTPSKFFAEELQILRHVIDNRNFHGSAQSQ